MNIMAINVGYGPDLIALKNLNVKLNYYYYYEPV